MPTVLSQESRVKSLSPLCPSRKNTRVHCWASVLHHHN